MDQFDEHKIDCLLQYIYTGSMAFLPKKPQDTLG